ncbi:FkbM family methyltransferase [Chitinophaga lutea]
MKDSAYYPSWKNFSKYAKYLEYFGEYIRFNDWKSLRASLRFVFLNKPTQENWEATSALGKFNIRPGTTDFQFINYAYEKKVRDYLKKERASGRLDSFVDIGACIGEYCVWLAGQGVQCVAFEPVNHAAVRQNISLNNVGDKVKLFDCGLGSKAEKVTFNVMSTVTGSSYIDRESGEGNIRIEKFDDLFAQTGLDLNRDIVVKLDVESMETEVLEGMRRFIAEAPRLRIIFERYVGDNTVNNKLDELAKFDYVALDEHNYLATKVSA